jgi:aspartate aminotransferase-like enzyme
MANAFGLVTDTLAYTWGCAADPAELASRLAEGDYKAVLIVHNETATGVLNPLEDLARVCRRHGALSIVDAISSLSTTPLPVDDWQLDAVITASQKGYYAPAGLCLMLLSDAAWQACEQARLPRFSNDLRLVREYAVRAQTPWTPPLPVYYALQAGFALLRQIGLPSLQQRHLELMRAVRAGVQALGLRLLVEDERMASRAVTPVIPPADLASDAIRQSLFEHFGISLGAGLRKQSGQLFRVGHLGYQDLPAILGVLGCLELTLQRMGHRSEPGAATAAALAAVASVVTTAVGAPESGR